MYITKLPFEGKFKVTYPYGIKDRNYVQGYHPGIDMGNSEMPSIYSIVDGVVSYAGWENINNQKQGFGKYVSIKFDVNTNGYKKVFLAHMSEIKCFAGQKVNPATIIGIMGSTGNSTGPHTHVEIRQYNAAGVLLKILNPATFTGIPNAMGTYDSANFRIDLNPPKPLIQKYKVTASDGLNLRVANTINSKIIKVAKVNTILNIVDTFQGQLYFWGKTQEGLWCALSAGAVKI